MTDVPAEVVTGNLLVDGALMLGAALFFVTLFRKLGLGATLGYIVGGAIIGPYALGLIGEADRSWRCRKSASRFCYSSSGWS